MKKLYRYLNPMLHLGEAKYSALFPLVSNFSLCVLSEIYVYGIQHDPTKVGTYIIFLNVAFIIYFAFRDGLIGGFISAAFAIGYYFYIIFSQHFTGTQRTTGIETTIGLAVIYFILAAIIGWLKQGIDKLIQRVADGKRRLETIIEQLPVGVLITDQEGILVERNKQVDDILGVKLPLGFVIGKDTLEYEKINGKRVNPEQSPLFQSLRTGKPIIGRELEFERRDGKKISLQVSSAPIHNAKNEVIAAASIISDFTRQKELERQKDQFLGIASHELKTPVTSIKAYGQVLQTLFSRKGDKQAVEQLAKMDAQINKLTNLIGDLLDVTKIQSGKLEFHEESFDFNTLVKEIVADIQLTTQKHELITKLGKTQRVYADRERIGQVLTNLITNAVKYSPTAEKVIVTSEGTETITVCVQDFGIGIPKEKQGRVFEQFFRVSGPNENTFPGLGLGLFISSEIIKREGGRIWVQSREGEGSTFCFSLPIVPKTKSAKKKIKVTR